MKKILSRAVNCMFYSILAIVFNPLAMADGLSIEKAKQYLAHSFPNAEIDSLKAAAMPGVYEVVIEGGVYYLTEDGKFLLAGSLYDLETGKDLTQQAHNELRSGIVARLAEREAITYAPSEYKYTINVFSDIECPSCRNFHSRIARVNELGIRVRYFLTPYLGDTAYRKAISVWCDDDRPAAMDKAKLGMTVDDKQCDNPIDENLRTAELLGIKGTPSFLFEDGNLLQGYRTPEALLDEAKKIASSLNR